ncbi:MAG TPA: AsmA family protein, partial [Fibrella sp.]
MKRFLVTTGLVILALVLLVVGFVTVVATTTWGQTLVTQQVNSYLGKKIKAPFRIGRISYRIPDWIELDDVFFVTPQGDTLLYGRKMRLDLDMMELLNNKVSINNVELEQVNLHVTRTLPDTAFNFNYILDAFNTAQPDTASLANKIAPGADTTSTPLDINLAGVRLRKVRIRYEDDVAGANVNAYVDSLRVNFSEVNVARSRYVIGNVAADGLNVNSRIYEGIPTPETPSTSGDTLTLGLGKWLLTNSRWDVRVETADFATTGKVGKLAMESDYFHLNGEKIGIRSLAMANSDITTTLLQPQRAQQAARSADAAVAIQQADPTLKAKVKAEERAEEAQPVGWIARVGSTKFSNNRIRFDDQTQPRQPRGLDYGHLDLSGRSVEGRNLLYSPDRISGQIRQGKFRDKSGFALQHFDVDLLYGEKATLLTNLFIRTPNTILRDRLELRYDSLGQLTRATEGRNLNRVRVLINLRQSRLAFADVLQLAPFMANTPPFAGNRSEVIRADAQMRGTLADLRIPKADFAMFSGTVLKASGRLTNVTNPDRLGMDLTLTDARTNRADMRKMLPPGTLPDSIALAPELKLTGKIRGTLNNLTTDARLA